MVGHWIRLIWICGLVVGVSACGEIGSREFASGKVRIYGSAMYAHDGILRRKAAYICPQGYTVLHEEMDQGAAESGQDLIMDIACTGAGN